MPSLLSAAQRDTLIAQANAAPLLTPEQRARLRPLLAGTLDACHAATAAHRARETADIPPLSPAMLRTRRDASQRMTPLDGGHRDPFADVA